MAMDAITHQPYFEPLSAVISCQFLEKFILAFLGFNLRSIFRGRDLRFFLFAEGFVILGTMRSLSSLLEMGVSGGCGLVAVVALIVAVYWVFRRWRILEDCRNGGLYYLLLRILCWKKNAASSSTVRHPNQICSSVMIEVGEEEEGAEAVKVNVWGPPWILFTITEETEEEMKAAEEESSTEERWPESAALPPRKLKSLMVGGKSFSVPFHPPPPTAQETDSCPSSSSSSDEIDGSFLTIVVE